MTSIPNVAEYTVSEIAGAVKRVVEGSLGNVRVKGEISGWKVHGPSGHAYFSLKDDKAVLDAVCWKGTVGKIPFRPEDGMEVVCAGRVTTYPSRSKYQISVEFMEPAGAGALMAQLELRKAKLAAEGLFAPERKRTLPYLPRIVGVVTSPTGAVIRDILHRIGDRFPVHVLVWPVPVQGEGAAEQIAAAIEGFNTLEQNLRPDVLIVARGGGSIEDLWAFNEEIVVRAAANSKIPLISAVGHETDTTLIDYASDRRAPTPTAAAEIAVPVREDLRVATMEFNTRLHAGVQRRLTQAQERIEGLSRGLPRPRQLLENSAQRLDDWAERLHAALPLLLQRNTQKLQMAAAALKPAALLRECDHLAQRLADLYARFESLNYKNVLKRGYALVKDAKDQLVTTAAKASAQPALTLVFQDGELKVKP